MDRGCLLKMIIHQKPKREEKSHHEFGLGLAHDETPLVDFHGNSVPPVGHANDILGFFFAEGSQKEGRTAEGVTLVKYLSPRIFCEYQSGNSKMTDFEEYHDEFLVTPHAPEFFAEKRLEIDFPNGWEAREYKGYSGFFGKDTTKLRVSGVNADMACPAMEVGESKTFAGLGYGTLGCKLVSPKAWSLFFSIFFSVFWQLESPTGFCKAGYVHFLYFFHVARRGRPPLHCDRHYGWSDNSYFFREWWWRRFSLARKKGGFVFSRDG